MSFASAAWADDAPTQSGVVCRYNGAEKSCSHFQGYVVVHHDTQGLSVSGDSAWTGQRLYLGVSAPNER